MQILDALQQTLDAVMKKTGEVMDDEAEKLLETMKGHNAALTEILLASPVQDVEQAVDIDVEQNMEQDGEHALDYGWYFQHAHHQAMAVMCNVCNIGFHSNVQLEAHKFAVSHKRMARALALGLAVDA